MQSVSTVAVSRIAQRSCRYTHSRMTSALAEGLRQPHGPVDRSCNVPDWPRQAYTTARATATTRHMEQSTHRARPQAGMPSSARC
jgi:hypothetical protein